MPADPLGTRLHGRQPTRLSSVHGPVVDKGADPAAAAAAPAKLPLQKKCPDPAWGVAGSGRALADGGDGRPERYGGCGKGGRLALEGAAGRTAFPLWSRPGRFSPGHAHTWMNGQPIRWVPGITA